MSIAPDIEEHRAYLIGIGYRMTGNLADAEYAVHEAWLRHQRLGAAARGAIRDQRAWLAAVIGRLCLDRLRSASARRESYIGPWLPEPLVTSRNGDDPLAGVARADDIRLAAMAVLERLTPPQRVAFVLHDALALSFEEIAATLGCTTATAREHASRARQALVEAAPPPRSEPTQQERLFQAFRDALARTDTPALVELLHPDAVLINDSGGMTPAARREIRGGPRVARLLVGLAQRYGEDTFKAPDPLLVNGELGYRHGGYGGAPEAISVFAVRDGRIVAVFSVLNPAKLRRALSRSG